MNLYEDLVVANNRVIGKSYAKINLTLDVIGKRQDGYHEISSVMQTINLFDLIIVDRVSSGISVRTNVSTLPNNEKNIAYSAAKKFFEHTKISSGARILIHKNIPISAGLAGGSGNGAAVLCALNRLHDNPLSFDELCTIGGKIGADVPFCIMGGTVLATGIGDKLTLLPGLAPTPILIVKPSVCVSTEMAYKKIDEIEIKKHPNTKKMVEAIENHNVGNMADEMVNVLEDVIIPNHPIIERIKRQMMDEGAVGAMMSGSGSSVFGIFNSISECDRVAKSFYMKYENVFSTMTR